MYQIISLNSKTNLETVDGPDLHPVYFPAVQHLVYVLHLGGVRGYDGDAVLVVAQFLHQHAAVLAHQVGLVLVEYRRAVAFRLL